MTKYMAQIEAEEYAIHIDRQGQISVNGVPCEAHLQDIDGQSLFSLLLGARSFEATVEQDGDAYHVTIEGQRYTVRLGDEQLARTAESVDASQDAARAHGTEPLAHPVQQAGAGAVVSPMTGVLIEILHGEGESVQDGEGLAILEAMKTENVIRAPRSGIVRDVQVSPGQTLRMDDVIMRIAAPES